ncbi:MAG: hypothetical protein K2O69_02980 [Odoribacter sp.]|nr:hypothetical protein [Odoribacter sp.]
MNKIIIKIGVIISLISGATMTINYSIDSTNNDPHLMLLSQIEALASSSESGGYIVCRCSKVTDQSCAVNNKGSVCASGDNIHCEQWNLNCHKNI